MSEVNSVKDLRARFNQGNTPPIGVRPMVAPRPGKPAKPSNLALFKDNSTSSNGMRSPSGMNGNLKSPLKSGRQPVGLSVNDLTSVKLKKPPLPRAPGELSTTETPVTDFKSQLRPKPRSVPPPRFDVPPPQSDASPQPHTPAKPPPPFRKDSLTKHHLPTLAEKHSPVHSHITDSVHKAENGRRDAESEEPIPPVSDSENSSASSVTDTPVRRTSFLHTVKSSNAKLAKPVLQPLPPLLAIGPAPHKPAKPPNVTLEGVTSSSTADVPPARPPKPGSSAPPSLPVRPAPPPHALSSPSKILPPTPIPVEEEEGEIYDDVENNPGAERPRPKVSRRPISLIRPMDSDEEDDEKEEEFDEIYDDAESTQPPPPVPPSVPSHPTLTVTASEAPPLPSIFSIPALSHGSGGSSISFPRSADHSGSGLEEPQEIYDDVSNAGDFDELYEALDTVNEDSNQFEMDLVKERDQQRKQEEKKKKEQEKLQKKEEERRKKKERDEKKKKEKEEKDMRKKFNIKGEINILDEGIVLESMDGLYEKHDLQCNKGDKVEILRKEGNPPGKWLARDTGGHYGYVDAQFISIEGDCQDVYDDVMAAGEEEDDIYDAVN